MTTDSFCWVREKRPLVHNVIFDSPAKESFRMASATNTSPRLPISTEAVADFCQRHHIRRFAFYGSILRADFGPNSDIDVLVEFEPDQVPGLLTVARIERELSEVLGGYKVDLRTPQELSRYFRDEVVQRSFIAYEQS